MDKKLIIWWLIPALLYLTTTKANLVQNCEPRAAIPVRFTYNDHSNGNGIYAKLRIDQPFGLYTARDGYMKWETLYQSSNCNLNRFSHVNCNITINIPYIEQSFELNIWQNCSWNYIINRMPSRRTHSVIIHNI